MKPRPKHFVAIHLGAGAHPNSRKEDAQYQDLCKQACKKALDIMSNGGSASDAVVGAISEIESSGLCNAGNGSVLNLSKQVELDSGFMNGDGYFGGVGALSNVKNPILVAKKLADLQIENNFRKDRIPPNFLVGNEATNFAKSNGIEVCHKEDLVSSKSKRFYEKHINSTEDSIASDPENDMVSDTIGAVAFDEKGNVASGVSSGGIWFKVPGRVGHSPIFGSGCYSLNGDKYIGTSSMAISTTGSGEMLSKTRLAYEFATAITNEQAKDEGGKCPAEILPDLIKTNFFESPLLKNHKEPKIIGLISLEWNGDYGEFISYHTSQNLIFAYGSSKSSKIHVKLSSLDPGKTSGHNYKLHAIPI